MKSNFQKVMPYIFSEEGGYVNNPADPGGATNMGITIATLSAWEGHRVSPEDVKNLTQATATKIYQAQFWNKIDGDSLPSGIDYAVFDFAVNSGPGRAAKMLQGILGVPEDGVIGAKTVAATNQRSADEVINALCDARASWLKGLSTASTFGKGWLARVERVRARALTLAAASPLDPPAAPPQAIAPKARQGDTAFTSALMHPEALGTMGSAASGLAAIVTGNGPVQYALAIVMLACAAVGLWYFIRRVRNEP
ncbi:MULTISPECIES: glycoside hydrolase family 108 protein [unclassified Ochrobactrum]|uniref:glycoside hydrolase family 108 protein n=1 Tax=unclassified Ochrobactrum TaxID=239106 RepID=UPI000DD5C7A2|nr:MULTISPECIES: glycoside hydrolase family 108 protein [unclassified Ochrobactrum]MBQ0708191.1 glycoside hydrolase family 108 protein [Ochrobactrum sp. AP1BH01-1]